MGQRKAAIGNRPRKRPRMESPDKPQTQTALEALNLKFLGFEMRDQSALRMFEESHPHKDAPALLALRHAFEPKNPDTFRSIYQFWCHKV